MCPRHGRQQKQQKHVNNIYIVTAYQSNKMKNAKLGGKIFLSLFPPTDGKQQSSGQQMM